MQSLQQIIPLPEDQLRIVLALFANFPLSIVMHGFKDKTTNLVYSTIMGFVLQIFVLQEQSYYLWIQELLVYAILVLAPRKRIGLIVLVESFTFLSAIHLRRYLSPSVREVDVTAIMMMNTCKFIILAYCYQDGAVTTTLTNSEMEERKLAKLPSFWMYLGYVQFLPSCLCGPVFEYRDYEQYLERKGDYANIPSTLMPATRETIRTLLCVATYMAMGNYLKTQYLISDQYAQRGFLFQFGFLMLVIVLIKFKYYSVWIMSMIAMHASGITYEKKKTQSGQVVDSWNRVQVINIWTVEFDPSIKNKIDAWDISVQVFLRRYIYTRLMASKQKFSPEGVPLPVSRNVQAKAQQLTILLSALWHGFFPSYVISFMHYFLVLQVVQQIYRIGRDTPSLNNLYRNNVAIRVLVLIVTNFFFSYFGVFFQLYTLDKIWKFSQASYGLPTLFTYAVYYIVVILRVGTPKHQKEHIKNN